ncbi:hypothetical protein GR702_11620 [Novosphingobium sp. FGD1]|uniref:Uncharacterized protein n=1 Tax=Novosphingobium silvae TaxID=2692619 RepID=A0A7X4GGY3_9SPHN|nr:hypothetical protein [Novosphingobium silvae]MYL98412.1 hypothetical protein [Novosphingobium silvae]
MKTALVGPNVNHKTGEIVETEEGARWIEFGIAEPVAATPAPKSETIEIAALPSAKEVTTRMRAKASKVSK